MDQFSKDEASEVFYKRFYIHFRPHHFRGPHLSTERTHENETTGRCFIGKTNSRRFARVLLKVNTTSLGKHREVPVSLNVPWEGETCN